MIATFLTETIKQKVEKSSDKSFVYFFFDDKGKEDRKTPTAMLRSLVWQLLVQNNSLFRHVQPDFEKHDEHSLFNDLFDRFSTMWRIFKNMIQDEHAGEMFILVDALDECDNATRNALLNGIQNIFDVSSKTSGRFKFLITHRSEISDIEGELSSSGTAFKVDSTNIDKDLKNYIDFKTQNLATLRNIPQDLAEKTKNTLTAHCDGTFLWVSLMTAELGRGNVLMHQFEEKLKRLPSKLDEIYHSILNQIPIELQDVALFILQSMVAAGRPFTKIELMTAFAASHLAGPQSPIPLRDDIHVYNDIFSACSSIIVTHQGENKDSETLSFCHQSVKDFLLCASFQTNKQWYNTTADQANLVVFQACWKYLSAENSKLAHLIVNWTLSENKVRQSKPEDFDSWTSTYSLLRYVAGWWQVHAISSYPAVLWKLEIDIKKTPLLREIWALREVRPSVVRFLIDNGLDIDIKDWRGRSLFTLAAKRGHVAMVELLAATDGANLNSKDDENMTALMHAVVEGHRDIVDLLLAMEQVNVDLEDEGGRSSLSYAAFEGHRAIVKMLLATGKVDVDSMDRYGQTALWWAAARGHEAITKMLLATGKVDVNAKCARGYSPLHRAILLQREATAEILIATGKADVDSKDHDGRTALWAAAARGDITGVGMLLATGKANVNSRDRFGRTPATCAAYRGHMDVIDLLLGADEHGIDLRDQDGRTPLSYAAQEGQLSMIQLLLSRGASDTPDYAGRSPLMYAVSGGHHRAVTALLAQDVSTIDSEDQYGSNALSIAVKHHETSIVQLLLNTGRFELDSRDRFGLNLLWWAQSTNCTEIELLILDAAKRSRVSLRLPDDRTVKAYKLDFEPGAVFVMSTPS
ncbi:hypothetical protein LTR66_015280 [Elasticomyces elasticus]|nr:hypothetical protein LTR66_015280 [Elasticomyces elasticus]